MTDFLLTPASQDGKTCVAGLADREGVPQAENIDISRLKRDFPELTRAVTRRDASEMVNPERPRFESAIRTPFPELAFQGTLRPSQREVIEMASAKLASGTDRRLHIVAPPGAGKTVLGPG